MRAAVLLTALTLSAHAQWTLQQSNTTADLRGIDNVGHGIAWASGSNGTVLHTTDDGTTWLRCPTPPNAEALDFRGIQAFDAQTAIVMSSGKGDLSRLYKTTDGCQTWKLIFTNPDPDGFWDALQAHIAGSFDKQKCQSVNSAISGAIFGDPTVHRSNQWDTTTHPSFYLATFTINSSCVPDELTPSATVLFSGPGEAAFAASNSLLIYNLGDGMFSFITGGSRSEMIHEEHGLDQKKGLFSDWSRSPLPFPSGSSSGAFSVAARPYIKTESGARHAVIVGGDYLKPDDSAQTAAYSSDWGNTWQSAQTPPHGYRSAVAYDEATKTWITVGPNGTDVSTDDGKNWKAVHPDASLHEAADADRNWNALSLPYVVGPKGRIGKLDRSSF